MRRPAISPFAGGHPRSSVGDSAAGLLAGAGREGPRRVARPAPSDAPDMLDHMRAAEAALVSTGETPGSPS